MYHLCMSKTITIDDDVYQLLTSLKLSGHGGIEAVTSSAAPRFRRTQMIVGLVMRDNIRRVK